MKTTHQIAGLEAAGLVQSLEATELCEPSWNMSTRKRALCPGAFRALASGWITTRQLRLTKTLDLRTWGSRAPAQANPASFINE